MEAGEILKAGVGDQKIEAVGRSAVRRVQHRTVRTARCLRRSVLSGLVSLIAGVGLVAVAVTVLDSGSPWTKTILIVAGLTVAFQGIRRVCRAAICPAFDTTLWFCGLWLVVIVFLAVLAPVLPLAPHADTAATVGAPSFAPPELFSAHPLGTNNLGLDELARVLYGARASLAVALGAVIIGIVVGGGIGLLAGYLRGAVDAVVGVCTNALLAFPPLILLLALASVLRPNLRNMAIALSFLAVPTNIRLARANTLVYAKREFVLAAWAMGAKKRRIILRELLPSVLLPVATYGMVLVSVLIVAEASLSFLGLGIQRPQPTWGNMIAEGLGGVFQRHPYIVLVPGSVLFVTVFAFSVVGERLRGRFDPRYGGL